MKRTGKLSFGLLWGAVLLGTSTALAQKEQWLEYHTSREGQGYRWLELTPHPPPQVALPKLTGQPWLARWSSPLDAEPPPSRRALRLITEQAEELKQKGLAVVVIQAGMMADEAFAAWKQESALPFPVARFPENPDKAKAGWGAAALPWLILTDKTRRVTAEGFPPEELSSRLEGLIK